jgi:hypothetical protein
MPLIEIPQCCSLKWVSTLVMLQVVDVAGCEGVDEVISRRAHRSGAGAAEADAGAWLVGHRGTMLAVVAVFAGWAGVDRDVTPSGPSWDSGYGGFDWGGAAAVHAVLGQFSVQ